MNCKYYSSEGRKNKYLTEREWYKIEDLIKEGYRNVEGLKEKGWNPKQACGKNVI